MFKSAFSSISDKNKSKDSFCVAIDNKNNEFAFYSIINGDSGTLTTSRKAYKSAVYSDAFYSEFINAVSEEAVSNPQIKDMNVTVVIPDSSVMMDTINIPNMNRKRNEDALDATISGQYKNKSDVTVNKFLAVQSKHVSTYSLSVCQNKLIEKIYDAVNEAGISLGCITFSSNGTANSICALAPKHKSNSFLFLDIKENSSKFTFVVKGRPTGFYGLPFGYSVLKQNKVYQEDMLFDHSTAELAVLNAREKAKAKQLTMMRDESVDELSDENEKLNAMFGEDENATVDPTANVVTTYKTLPKKEPRKLPKYMLRPIPHEENDFIYENFRIFVKWALNLIQANDKLSAQGKPENIVVNMPKEYGFVLDMVNAESEENGIDFVNFEIHETKRDICENLDIFGGLFTGLYNKNNNF